MKKIVRFLGLCALVALAFTACKKNDTKKVTIKATICQPTSTDRTYITGLNEAGDKVLKWGGDEEITVFNRTLTGDNGCNIQVSSYNNKYAYFSTYDPYMDDISIPNRYIAFYPNAAVNPENNKVELTIPNQQSYDWYRIANNIFPMYGFNTENYNIFFHSHAGVLGLRFLLDPEIYGGTPIELPLQKIVLTGFNNADTGDADVLAGTMAYDLDGNYTMTNTGNVVELTGGSLRNTNPTEFYFILPEGALANGFTVQIIRDNGTSIIYEGKSVNNGGQAIEAEHVTYMPQIWIRKTFD